MKREPKIKVLEQLYLQLIHEIDQAAEDVFLEGDATIILSEDFVYELKFRKKIKRVLALLKNND